MKPIYIINPNVNWDQLASNPNPLVIPILKENLNKLSDRGWLNLNTNPNTIHILERNSVKVKVNLYSVIGNLDRVDWSSLSSNPNPNPNAISILQNNLDRINWFELSLSANPNALHLLFPYNFPEMTRQNEEFNRELTAHVLHPKHLQTMADVYANKDVIDYMERLGYDTKPIE